MRLIKLWRKWNIFEDDFLYAMEFLFFADIKNLRLDWDFFEFKSVHQDNVHMQKLLKNKLLLYFIKIDNLGSDEFEAMCYNNLVDNYLRDTQLAILTALEKRRLETNSISGEAIRVDMLISKKEFEMLINLALKKQQIFNKIESSKTQSDDNEEIDGNLLNEVEINIFQASKSKLFPFTEYTTINVDHDSDIDGEPI